MKTAPQNYVVVGLGSNLGDSKAVIAEATARLTEFSDGPMLRSSVWVTSPVDCPPGSPNFLNAVVAFVPRTAETPETLLKSLQKLEKEFGRKAKVKLNEPRVLDLDIIAFQTELRRDTMLTVPHPRAHERAFVLAPLSEILPHLILPGQSETVVDKFHRMPAELKAGAWSLKD